MVLETSVDPKPEQQQQQQQRQTDGVDEEPEPVIGVTTSGSIIFDKAYQMMERFSSMRIGQFVLERGDRVLRVFEDTAKWSLPQDKADETLVRPLPWLPFLFLIVFLRQLRIWLSLVALLIGDGPVTASSLVYFIQTRRRKLRSIRMHGLKAIQQREEERKAAESDHNSLVVRLSKLFTTAMCRPRIHCEPAGVVFSANNPAMQELLRPIESPRFRFNKRQREDDSPEVELSCSQLLTKYANENSDDDSDYIPILEDEDTNNESTISANTSNDTQGEYSMFYIPLIQDTSDENAKDLSFTEKKDIKDGKSPREKKVPIIEINAKEAGSTSTPNNEHNDKKGQAAQSVNDKTITKSPQTPHTPLDNGQSKSGKSVGPGEEAAVVQTQAAHEITKSQSEKFFTLLNGHNDEQKKATPGHESAAHTKPHLPPSLLGNVVANANPSDGTYKDANDACSANPIDIPTNNPVQPQQLPLPTTQQPLSYSSTLSSPSCSTTSSTSSLASFVTSDDFVVDDGRSDPPTPTPSLNTASSTEDIYLSPFGSPPNFNTIHKPLSSQQNSNSKFGELEADPSVEDGDEHSQHAQQSKPHPEHKPQHQQQQHKQSHHQRYRRNRR
ncbi:transcription factor stalky isoform X1 [Zeugodacus cucurbitae]|uniref:transcription factor stalky isoform X1 n=1 Tax=Zeugodacus cucurbitae TaxID=28588 RepID=UPI0023D930CD|nr:transcription factor stalky isoform X1 [Zeugodacus cucurbitae]